MRGHHVSLRPPGPPATAQSPRRPRPQHAPCPWSVDPDCGLGQRGVSRPPGPAKAPSHAPRPAASRAKAFVHGVSAGGVNARLCAATPPASRCHAPRMPGNPKHSHQGLTEQTRAPEHAIASGSHAHLPMVRMLRQENLSKQPGAPAQGGCLSAL